MKMIHMNVCNGEIRYLKLVPYDEQVFDNAKRSGYTEGIYNPKGIEYIDAAVECIRGGAFEFMNAFRPMARSPP